MPPYLKNTISIYKRKNPVAPPSKRQTMLMERMSSVEIREVHTPELERPFQALVRYLSTSPNVSSTDLIPLTLGHRASTSSPLFFPTICTHSKCTSGLLVTE
jgi:hypothetical protein